MSVFQISKEEAQVLGRVAVIYGGDSSERVISLQSGTAVLSALHNAGVDAFALDLIGESNLNPVQQLLEAEFDRAFLILHGPGGEDGRVQACLDLLGKPYTGSNTASSSLAMDKVSSKQIWQQIGLPTPDFILLESEPNLELAIERLGLPLFIKPACEGSSIGIAKVNNLAELTQAYQVAIKLDKRVMVERCVEGKEFTLAILNNQALPIIKLEPTHDFYDFAAKYQTKDTGYILEHGLIDEEVTELNQIGLNAFSALGCEGWARVDFMQDEQGQFQILEINTAPGMTNLSLVPMAAASVSISFEQLVVEILRATVNVRS